MPEVPLIPDTAPFTAEQRVWLNGFLAGLFSSGPPGAVTPALAKDPSAMAGPRLLILFGSQTGTAERLARELAREAKNRGANASVVDADAHAKVDWKQETNLLMITSTYGDGDMPDNARGFWDWLQTEAAAALAHLTFSVLALGDTAYEHFCAAGKKIDAQLEQLGARRCHALVECDLDYAPKAKAWTEAALSALMATEKIQVTPPAALAESPARPEPAAFSKKNPFPARLVANLRLNGEGSEKETRHFEISLEGSGLEYEAGDALGVCPTNCPAFAEDLLRALGADGEEAVPVNGADLPLRKALIECFDISRPTPELLRRLGEQNATLHELLNPDRRDDLKKWLGDRGIIELLGECSAAKLAPAEFTGFLRRLAPRLYSLASSPKAHRGQAHLTVNIVRHDSCGRPRKGVCSTFLADRAGRNAVPVFIQTSNSFRLPAAGDTPVIMVGPGTGVAPFRAFLHERRATGARGRNWLFFGEQRGAKDFYYREELEQMLADGHLSRLATAFSRDQAEKIYVQHRLLEHAKELWSWLQDGAHFYVCGDASRMARDVEAALHQVIETAGGLRPEAAQEYVARLRTEKRYQRDVY